MPPCEGNFDVRIGVEHLAQDSEGVIVCGRCGLTIIDRGGQLFPAIVAAEELRARVWLHVKDGNPIARALFGRHYTYNRKRDQISMFWQRNRNYSLIAGPGQKMVLITPDGQALFVWRKFRSMDHQEGVNCAVFRNEGQSLSSELIRAADALAWERWPGERLYTYVDPSSTKRKRDPGRCFLRAGWQHYGWTPKGLRILDIRP